MSSFEVGRRGDGKFLFAAERIGRGDAIVAIGCDGKSAVPTLMSLQVGKQVHAVGIGEAAAYINHSCRPNAFPSLTDWTFRALADIDAGEEICFFYPATEWDMAEPFKCRCGHPECLTFVCGARYLSPLVIGRYIISRHVADLVVAAVCERVAKS